MNYRMGVLAVLVAVAACGGGPTSPSPGNGGGGGGGGGGDALTITITASGVSPREITVPAGSRVTFFNNDTRNHEMNSDPHPNHGECPAIDDVGFLAPGQRKQTGNLTVVRRCGFHDHNQPEVAALQGTIVVQ